MNLTPRLKLLLGVVVIVGAIWYVFIRDTKVQPDKPPQPGPVQPVASTPFEQFQSTWNANDHADWKVAEHLPA